MEQRAMGTATQESLDEPESRKQLEKPVHEQTEEQLKLRYDRSYILKQVDLDIHNLLHHNILNC